MDTTTARLADYALHADYSKLSAQTVHACKRALIDAYACAFGAYNEPLSRMSREVASRYGGDPSASVWGGTASASPEAAAFANGVMVRLLDVSDTYLGQSRGHPSDMISGIVAIAESVHASGAEVLNAIALAYDVYCSFCDAIDINSKGWDQPVYAGLGCALAVGKLLGLDRAALGNAVALALVPNMALFQTRTGDLSGWKGCASANAVRNAVFAARLAQDGFTGPTAAFEGKAGMWDVVGRPEWVLPGDGAHKIVETHMKCFPICYHGQSAAWAAFELRERVSAQEIEAIEVQTYRQAVAMMGSDASRWAPETRDTADHSMPYVISTALIDGELTSQSFAPEMLKRKAVLELMPKIKVSEDPELSGRYPDCAACRLTARTRTGATHVVEMLHAKGHVNAPLDDAELEKKFRVMFREYGAEADGERILQALWSFDRSADAADLVRLVQRSARPSAASVEMRSVATA